MGETWGLFRVSIVVISVVLLPVISRLLSRDDFDGDALALLAFLVGVLLALTISLKFGSLAAVAAILALLLGLACRYTRKASVCAEMARDAVLIRAWQGAAR